MGIRKILHALSGVRGFVTWLWANSRTAVVAFCRAGGAELSGLVGVHGDDAVDGEQIGLIVPRA